jgi:hypothetical protein
MLLLLDCLLWHGAISMPSILWWLPIFLSINTTHEQEMLDKGRTGGRGRRRRRRRRRRMRGKA